MFNIASYQGNANRKNELSLHTVRIATVKKTTNNKCWQRYREKGTYTVSGNVNFYTHYGKQHGGFSKKLKIELPYDPAIPLLGIYPKKMKT